MKTTMKWITCVCIALTGAIIFYACSKNDSAEKVVPPGKQEVSLYLTDGPFFFDQVLIDIKSVKLLVDTCDRTRDWRPWDDDDDNKKCYVWDSLAIRPGIYDLLTLRNGTDTLFANGIIPEGRIKKIRIELGSNHSLVKDSVSYPLQLPPGFSTSLILKLHGNEWDEFRPGRFRLWLDFDVARSIIQIRNNLFWLKPVIHLFVIKSTGSIEGSVGPRDAEAVISVYNSTDTAYALPWHEGKFKVRGLEEGTYSVFINGSNGYKDTTITNVAVKRGKETDIGKITLHK